MKLCIPKKNSNGLESEVYSHFGSASAYIIYDTEKKDFIISNNADKQHWHGQCQPLNSLNGNDVNVVIVGGIGQRAIMKQNALNITVFKSEGGTAKENIDRFLSSRLEEFSTEYACEHHGQGHGCD